MDNEGWPQPPGLQGVLRRLLGRPATDGTDDVAMRADAERLGDELAAETNTNDQAIHPGFHGLVSRSGQRMARRMRRPGAALAKALAKHTEAQAALDRREYDRGVVARLVDDLPPLPAAPRLGVALTQPWAVWLLMLLVLVPLEGVLTYQQILILGLDVNLTKLFAALIGAALTVSAEVLGTLVAHLGSQADGDRRSTQHRGTYWMAALLVCVTATVAVATITTLATSREANQQIVEQRRQQIEQLNRQFNRPGYTSPDGPPAAVQEQTDSAKINLGFTLWLQLLGLLAAVGLGLRRRLAEDYQAAATMRRTTLRRAQFSERAVSRGERAVTRSAGRQEAVMRTMRTIVEDEYRFLQSLFQRTLQRYRMASGNAAEGCPTPVLPELEDVIRHFLEPKPPARPAHDSERARRSATAASDAVGAAAPAAAAATAARNAVRAVPAGRRRTVAARRPRAGRRPALRRVRRRRSGRTPVRRSPAGTRQRQRVRGAARRRGIPQRGRR